MQIASYFQKDTIAAIATPPGEGGIGIVRISGPEAQAIAKKLFKNLPAEFKSHHLYHGHFYNRQDQRLDEGLIVLMRAPHSYTGEDVIECHCHGNILILKEILETCMLHGARLAFPGEFTFRAYLNQKIDLSQAEAVQQVIGAKNQLALHAAEEQLEGRLSKKVDILLQDLLQIAAILEAWVDFPEEGLEFATFEEIDGQLGHLIGQMEKLSHGFTQGKIISEGVALSLIGIPNVGKSSLMNALLGKDRAIVSSTAGTTRDVLEEAVRLGPLHARLIDTAGIRQSHEEIEKEGIRRSQQAMERSDIILFLLDASTPITKEEEELLSKAPPEKTILVWNKIDLLSESYVRPHHPSYPYQIALSAKENQGVDQIATQLEAILWKGKLPDKDQIMLTNFRHKEALDKGVHFLYQVKSGLVDGISPELLAMDIRSALSALGQIIRVDPSEDILTAIFSKFCVGK